MPKRKSKPMSRTGRTSKRRRTLKPYMKRFRKIPLALQRHSFVERKVTDLTMQVDNEGDAVGLFKSFNLDDCSNAQQYKTLFEYYKIDKVVVTFRYKTHTVASTSGTIGPRPNEVNPLLYFKVDHNDITADSLIQMRLSTRTKEKQLSNDKSEFTIQVKPAVQAEAYKSTVATTYIPKWGQWLSTADGTVPHYGLKAYAVGYRDSASNPGQIQVSFKYYISFKNNE